MIAKIVPVFMLLLLIAPFVYAQDSGVSALCIDNQTLQTSLTKVKCITIGASTQCQTTQENTTLVCPNGCDTSVYPNTCAPTEFEANFLVLIFLLAVIAFVAVIAKKYG